MKNKYISKVRINSGNNQRLVYIPKAFLLDEGDFVVIEKYCPDWIVKLTYSENNNVDVKIKLCNGEVHIGKVKKSKNGWINVQNEFTTSAIELTAISNVEWANKKEGALYK